MDFTAPLMALANFGTGYIKGQNQAQDRQYLDTLRQNNLDKLQQQSEADRYLSDRAMELWHPDIKNPVNGQPVDQATNPPPPPQQPPSSQEMSQRLMQLAGDAYSKGYISQGNTLATNAMNLNNDILKGQAQQSVISQSELKRQAQSHKEVAQLIGSATDENSFQRAQMQVLADPVVSPEEKQNIARMQYSPGLVKQIRLTGMNSSQQAQNQLDQMRQQEISRHNQVSEQNSNLRTQAYQARTQAEIEKSKNSGKVGNVGKAPSVQEVGMAARILNKLLSQQGITPDSSDYNYQNITAEAASAAKKLVAQNKGLSYMDAVNTVLSNMQQSGELKIVKPVHHWLSSNEPGGPQEYSGTQGDPIPLQGLTKEDLIPGKWYVDAKGNKHQY